MQTLHLKRSRLQRTRRESRRRWRSSRRKVAWILAVRTGAWEVAQMETRRRLFVIRAAPTGRPLDRKCALASYQWTCSASRC